MTKIIYQVEYSVIDNKGSQQTHYDKIFRTGNFEHFKKYIKAKGLIKHG